MRIRKALLASFGRFQNLHLEFGPGLNVIYGPNEAGKSTLMRFVQGMLFGLQKPGAQRRHPLPELDRLRPWSGASPRGSLIYDTSDGIVYRVERDFGERGGARIFDAATGQELTSRFREDRRKELLFAEEQLGLSDGAFAATACIGQMKASEIDQKQELTTRLANLAGGGDEDVSVTGVLRTLDQEMAKIGHPARDSGKPLAEAIRQVSRLEAGLERGRQVRQENLHNERRLKELQADLEAHRLLVAEAGRGLAARRREELSQRLKRLKQLREDLSQAAGRLAQVAQWAGFPAEHRERVAALRQSVAQLERQTSDQTEALEVIRSQRAQAAAALAAYGPLLALGPDAEAQANRDFGEYSRAQQDLQLRLETIARRRPEAEALAGRLAAYRPLVTEGTAWEARLDALDEQARESEFERGRLAQSRLDRLAEREAALRLQGGRRPLALAAALLSLAAAAAAAWLSGQPLAAALGLLALPLWFLLSRPSRAARQALQSAEQALRLADEGLKQRDETLASLQQEKSGLLAQAGCTSVAELKARVRACQRLSQEQESLSREMEQLERDRATIERALQQTGGALAEMIAAGREAAAGVSASAAGVSAAALPESGGLPGSPQLADPAGLDPLALSDQHIRSFRRVWASYRQVADTAEHLATREQQLAGDLARTQGELEEARRDLLQGFQEAGVSDYDEYRRASENHEQYREAAAAHTTAQQLLGQALSEGDEAALERQIEDLGPAEPVSAVTDPNVDLRELSRRWELLKEGLARKQAEVRGLEERIEQAYRDLPDVASLEAELEQARQERSQLESRRWVLERAREEIEAASEEVHREFAPRLNQAASKAIAAITGGRYEEVRVDSHLGLRVVAPETGELRPVEELSGGTLDQFYLALRLGMATLLTAGGEPVPFLLDDTFVQFDDQRLARAMDQLTQVARTNQVLLFTCHRREVEAARLHQENVRIIELPSPVQA